MIAAAPLGWPDALGGDARAEPAERTSEPLWEVPPVVFWREPIDGNGNLVTRELPLPSDAGLTARLPFPVTVRRVPGVAPHAVVTIDENLLPLLEAVRDRDGVNRRTVDLHLSAPCRSWAPARMEVIVPHLRRLATYGPGSVTVTGLESDLLDHLHFAGAPVEVGGRVDRYVLRLYGTGDVDASDLLADRADLEMLGAGGVRLPAPVALHARLYGSGDVICIGEPDRLDARRFGRGVLLTELDAPPAP
ncbi:MAG: DUF2807 domain-containing protein [Candidatus Krumholzibacteriia bacterium]